MREGKEWNKTFFFNFRSLDKERAVLLQRRKRENMSGE